MRTTASLRQKRQTGRHVPLRRPDDDGQIVEENLMYDLVTFMKQIRLSS
jgi:hypothetical protein